ncbi:hypothetical protein ACO2Q9_12325 [Variovorax sp. VNK109]|uniref:hypothetical protein n=1 Tax=Variovorax sp. VNK109 TaxID=3400919 RepID=UPI003C0DC5DF
MTLELLHQVGHNANWNVASFEEDNCGAGLILSPLHQNMGSVEKLDKKTRAVSIFDPQFYLPSSRKPKLLTYPFFPESVDGGFQTSTFGSQAKSVAKACVDFQLANGFRSVVIPTRFLDQMYSNYFDRQKQFTVEAFMEAAGNHPSCLSVAVTDAMLQDAGFRKKLLNWVTAYPNVDELYLMYQHPRDTKMINDALFLKECSLFFREIVESGLKLIVGYTNVEGLLFSTVGEISLTIGSFENTRIFSIDKFLSSDEERRGPKARIYLAGLMNWVQYEDARTIRKDAPEVWKTIYEPTPYSEAALKLPVEPTFNQPQLYKHYFINMADEFNVLKKLKTEDRRRYLLEKLAKARLAYSKLEKHGVKLEKHGRNHHIDSWIKAIS